MPGQWEKLLEFAEYCAICSEQFRGNDQRILSVYLHQPICMECKKEEEGQKDYTEASKVMLSECIYRAGQPYEEPESYCLYHFTPYPR